MGHQPLQKNLKLLLQRPKGSSACTEIVAVMITHTIIELKAVALVATVVAVEVSVAKLELIVEKTDLKRPRLQLKQSKLFLRALDGVHSFDTTHTWPLTTPY